MELGLSRYNQAALQAKQRGYCYDSDGSIYKNGNKLKLQLKARGTFKGYLTFSVRMGSLSTVNLFVHRFIAFCEFGEDFFTPGLVVRHLDGNSFNNSPDNLKLGTQSDNMMDRPRDVRVRIATQASRAANPRSVDLRHQIYEKLRQGASYGQIGVEFDVSKSTCSYIRNKSQEYKEYVRETEEAERINKER